jgi:hypothetical protein
MKDTEATADKQVPTFENLLLPIAHLENEWEFEKDCLEFLTLYSPDESLRNAAKEMSVIIEKGNTVRDGLWKFIKAVWIRRKNSTRNLKDSGDRDGRLQGKSIAFTRDILGSIKGDRQDALSDQHRFQCKSG